MGYHENLALVDEVIGIDGIELDDCDRSYEHRRFFELIGSNKFKMGKYIHTTDGGASSKYVVIFRINHLHL